MTTAPGTDLEQDLARARPRLMALAADLASNGDQSQPVSLRRPRRGTTRRGGSPMTRHRPTPTVGTPPPGVGYGIGARGGPRVGASDETLGLRHFPASGLEGS